MPIPARRTCSTGSTWRTSSCSATTTTLYRPTPSRGRGPTRTRTPPPRSTTPPAPPPGPRACSSRTATSGSTRRCSGCTPRSATATCCLHTLPMFHANGWGMPFGVTGVGGKHVVLRQVDGAEILRRVERARRHADVRGARRDQRRARRRADVGRRDPGPRTGVRIVVAGAPPPTRTIERVLDELGWEFIQIYGLTETSPLLTINRQPRRMGRARHARAGPPARPRRRAGPRRAGARSTPTARCIAAVQPQPRRLLGTARRDRGGAARQLVPHRRRRHLDDDGYLVISDRKKDVIISGGENVSSIEVEDALMSHPAVREVAVIGIPDEKWGELVTALVVTDGTRASRAEDLIAHCREVAGRLQVPEAGRVRRRAAAHRHRQAAEVQAARAVLGRARAPGQLAGTAVRAEAAPRSPGRTSSAMTRISSPSASCSGADLAGLTTTVLLLAIR